MTDVLINNEQYGALACPSCGGDNLHHEAIHVWDRYKEDAEQGTYVLANGTKSVVVADASMTGNPSRRRDGMTIVFSCEHCNGVGVGPEKNPSDAAPKQHLHIVQHKGTTYVSWNQAPL
jgi:ribosomal protein L37AE/L43A